MKPLLLLDIDGPLNPTLPRVDKRLVSPHRDGERAFRYHQRLASNEGGLGLWVTLADEWGAELMVLKEVFDLVWATTWEHDANRLFWKHYGLPSLPVIRWPSRAREWALYPRHRGSWKTKHILAWLDEKGLGAEGARRPWVWVDDEITSADRKYVAEHYGEDGVPFPVEGPVVDRWLFRIEDHHGLRANDFLDLREWSERRA